jgi:Na+(H+)/acetate symporter ActP
MMKHIVELIERAQGYAKALVAAVGTLLVAASGLSADLGITLIPQEATPWVTFALAVLTAFSTWAVPNVEAAE